MDKVTHITKMTFYHYNIDIAYLSTEGGAFGFMYTISEGDDMIEDAFPHYKTALDAGIAALESLKEMHNEKN